MLARLRGRMLINSFSFQATVMLFAALTGLFILHIYPEEIAWRYMLAAGAIPSFAVMVLRVYLPESPRWLIEKGYYEKAAQITARTVPAMKDQIDVIVRKANKHCAKLKRKS